MKSSIICLVTVFALTFASCKKCVVCNPYKTVNGNLVLDNGSGGTQSIKLCDKIDINAYESGTSFQDANRNPVKFMCK